MTLPECVQGLTITLIRLLGACVARSRHDQCHVKEKTMQPSRLMHNSPVHTSPSAALLMSAVVVASGMAISAHPATLAQQQSTTASSSTTASDNQLIRSAMEAAPAKVGANATIVVMEPGSQTRTLRQGTNGFTCMPDNPATPSPDPMCMDRAALDWINAWMARKTPVSGKIGFMYMLAGGTDASNTDPFASKPLQGNNWIQTGPHVMIVGADPGFYNMYPKQASPDTAAPYVMWPNTPYQHLMIPVK